MNNIALPPLDLLERKPIRKAAEEYDRLVREEQSAGSRRHELEQGRHEAAARDRDAYAIALRHGEADPGTPETEQADREILAAARRQEALEVAVRAAHGELVAAVEQHGPAWRKALEERVDRDRESMAAALDKLAEVHDASARTLALLGWLDDFPGKARWRPAKYLRAVRGLHHRSGDPVNTDQAIAALRELTRVSASVERPPAQPLRPHPMAAPAAVETPEAA